MGAVVASYLITLSPLLAFGWEGRWLALVLLAGPSPVLAISAMVAFAFPATVLRHPFVWALAAAITAWTIASDVRIGRHVVGAAGDAFCLGGSSGFLAHRQSR